MKQKSTLKTLLMSTVKILSSDGLTEIAEQQISETRNLFFESPTAPSLNSISTTPSNVFVDDAAEDAILWSDGVETPLTMSVSEASSQGTQTAALSLPENVISKKLAEVAEVNSVLNFDLGRQTIRPESPSIILRNTEGLDDKTTILPFIKVGAMEVAINGTKLISGTKDNKKITAANYADGSSFSMNLADNLPNSKLIDIVRAYYESRGAEVNIRKGGGMVINPFANCLTSFTRSNSGTTAKLFLKSLDNFQGESYFFSCVASSVAADYVRLTMFKADGTTDGAKRYIEKEGLTGGGSLVNCRIAFKSAQHQYTEIAVSFEDYSSSSAASSATFTNVMLSRSDILTPYTSDLAETKEQLTMLEAMDVAVSYPFATAVAGKPAFWKSWKLGGYNAPAKTVTAGYSSGLTAPVLSVTKNSVGGVDTSAINIGINGKATTGHYLDEKGAPLSGLFFSSRKDLQTSAGFLAKWLFAACSRKLTITQPRGGSFGEVMEEQGDNSTNYYMFAPLAQPLNGYNITLPAVATSRALTTWQVRLSKFEFDSSLFDMSFSSYNFLGFFVLVVNLKKVKPATDMANFAAAHSGDAAKWFTYSTQGSFYQEPQLSTAYKSYFASHTIYSKTSNKYSATILGFTRTPHKFTNTRTTGGGEMPESVTLRKDAPCRFVETWEVGGSSSTENAQKFISVKWNGKDYRYATFSKSSNRAVPFIVTFQSGTSVPSSKDYGSMRMLMFPDTVSEIRITYYADVAMRFTPKLYYYQLNQN